MKAGSRVGSSPRLLLISYHFPPSEEIGALRWRRMIPLLAERGWGVDVITVARISERVHPAASPGLAELPEDTAVVGVAVPTPFAAQAEFAVWRVYRNIHPRRSDSGPEALGTLESENGGDEIARAPGSWPTALPAADARWGLLSARGLMRLFWTLLERRRCRLWSRRAAEVALELARTGAYRALAVSTPPHWTQEAGRRVAAATGLPYLADLRDPWAATAFLPEHVASRAWLRLAEAEERATVRAAALVLANTEPSAEVLRRSHPNDAGKIVVVRNGWDREPPPVPERRRFTIAYAGSIYGDRSPEALFRAVARMRAERDLNPSLFGVEMMGRIDRGEDWVRRLAESLGVGNFVRLRPPSTRAAAERFMARAAVLVSLPWGQDLSVPAKVYDYLRFEAWPLVLAAPGSAPARLLEGTGVAVVHPDEPDRIADVLCDRYDRWSAGERPGRVAGRELFSREAATDRLLEYLQMVVT